MINDNKTDMEEDNMKRVWRDSGALENKGSLLRTAASEQILYNGRKTALMRLADRYTKFYRISLVFTVITPCMFAGTVRYGGSMPYIWLAFTLYFLTAAVIDWHLSRKVAGIRVDAMPTSEVIRRAMGCRKLHLQSMMFLLPFAIAVITLLAWSMDFETYFVISLLAGFVVGVVIGVMQFIDFMRDYRSIRSE